MSYCMATPQILWLKRLESPQEKLVSDLFYREPETEDDPLKRRYADPPTTYSPGPVLLPPGVGE
jgi:hypothetical protein